jgi:hypothetical protein
MTHIYIIFVTSTRATILPGAENLIHPSTVTTPVAYSDRRSPPKNKIGKTLT